METKKYVIYNSERVSATISASSSFDVVLAADAIQFIKDERPKFTCARIRSITWYNSIYQFNRDRSLYFRIKNTSTSTETDYTVTIDKCSPTISQLLTRLQTAINTATGETYTLSYTSDTGLCTITCPANRQFMVRDTSYARSEEHTSELQSH